jgi:RNA polymerase-binding transcription factor DksA
MTSERLNALPMAALCGSCQRRLEIPKVETVQRGCGT